MKTSLTTTGGFGRSVLDTVQLVQQSLKAVGIEVELKFQDKEKEERWENAT